MILQTLSCRYSLNNFGQSNLFHSKSWSSPYILVGLYSPEEVPLLDKEIARFRDKVLDRRNPNGEFIYARLYHTIVTKWGYGAWRDDKDTIFFDVKNHVKIYPKKPKGDKDYFTEEELGGEICKVNDAD